MDTCVADLRFGSQNDNSHELLAQKYVYDLPFFSLSFAPNSLEFGYVILEHIIYARMKLFFFQFHFVTLFRSPQTSSFLRLSKHVLKFIKSKKGLRLGIESMFKFLWKNCFCSIFANLKHLSALDYQLFNTLSPTTLWKKHSQTKLCMYIDWLFMVDSMHCIGKADLVWQIVVYGRFIKLSITRIVVELDYSEPF